MKTEDILKLLILLKSKESMVTGRKLSITEFKYFLDGLILGIGLSAMSISQWLRKKYDTEINVGWSDYILDKYFDLQEDEVKRILLLTLEEYLNQTPNSISD
jgi:hypothetical protein